MFDRIIGAPFDRSFTPGSRRCGILHVGTQGQPCEIPWIRIDGRADGRSLVVTAGVHGAEYPGIEALVRLSGTLDPTSFTGTVVLVPIANLSAFEGRSAFVTPVDGRNLNRSFPGSPDGSYTERLAHSLSEQFVSPADAYVDLHSGDLVEALHPFVSYCTTGHTDVDTMSRSLAHCFGIETIIPFASKGREGLSHVAAALGGTPSLLAEIGGQGVWREHEVAVFLAGISNVLRTTGMSDDTLPVPPPRDEYSGLDWYTSAATGLWRPQISAGEIVVKGQTIGTVSDYFGDTVKLVAADHGGMCIFVLTALSVRKDDAIAGIALP